MVTAVAGLQAVRITRLPQPDRGMERGNREVDVRREGLLRRVARLLPAVVERGSERGVGILAEPGDQLGGHRLQARRVAATLPAPALDTDSPCQADGLITGLINGPIRLRLTSIKVAVGFRPSPAQTLCAVKARLMGIAHQEDRQFILNRPLSGRRS